MVHEERITNRPRNKHHKGKNNQADAASESLERKPQNPVMKEATNTENTGRKAWGGTATRRTG